MAVLLTRRAVVRAKLESTYNVAPVMGQFDGLLVSEPMYTVETNVLERDFTRDSISRSPHIIGRKTASMTFTTELRGNGRQFSGDAADAPLIARLFQACGYNLVEKPAPHTKGPFDIDDHMNTVLWETDVLDADNTDTIAYFLEVTTPGASGVAEITVTSETAGESGYPGERASGTVTFAGATGGADGDTVTINGETITLVAAAPVGMQALVGATAAETAQNVLAVINANPADFAVTASGDGAVLTLRAIAFGVAGNSITLASVAATPSDIVVSGANLTGGAAGSATVTVTSGEPFAVGTQGLIVTPDFTGELFAGQKWVLWLFPTGLLLEPISDNFQSITLEMNKDGVHHVMPGAFGTFEITATAGEFATVSWTFNGHYNAPTDAPAPSVIYERTLPPQVELARLRLNGFYAIVETLSFNQSNDIQIRPDVSSEEGIIGTRIVSRAPEGGINPEATLVADNDFWGDLTTARRMPLQMRVGQERGNTVWMVAPGVQYTGLTYADRNGIMTYDAGLMFPAYQDNDEVFFVFC